MNSKENESGMLGVLKDSSSRARALARHVSNGCKSRIRPTAGRIQPKARVSIVRWNLKEAGCPGKD